MVAKMWNVLQKSYMEAQTLNKFKLDSKHLKPSNWPCDTTFEIGFIN